MKALSAARSISIQTSIEMARLGQAALRPAKSFNDEDD
jgi:hypothetical protein